jgi:hypothetical protein
MQSLNERSELTLIISGRLLKIGGRIYEVMAMILIKIILLQIIGKRL